MLKKGLPISTISIMTQNERARFNLSSTIKSLGYPDLVFQSNDEALGLFWVGKGFYLDGGVEFYSTFSIFLKKKDSLFFKDNLNHDQATDVILAFFTDADISKI